MQVDQTVTDETDQTLSLHFLSGLQQVQDGGYESSVSHEKHDTQDGNADSQYPISLKVRTRTVLSYCTVLVLMEFGCPWGTGIDPVNYYLLSDVLLAQTDKSGRLLLETSADLQNLLLLRKTKREQKAAVRKPAAVTPPSVERVVRPSHICSGGPSELQ